MDNGRLGNFLFFAGIAALLVAMPLTSHAVTFGQIDDFQDGTAQNWQTGVGPVGVATDGGPAGIGDHYLRAVSSGGFGSDGKMVVFNSAQWQGDYTDAGITGITVNLNNLSSQPLSIRIVFFQDQSDG